MIIKLKPFAAPRPRFSKYGTYNSKEYTSYKHLFGLLAKSAYKKHLEGALRLEVTFFMQIPKSLSKKKHNELIGKYHIKKSDLDNLVKTVLDSLEGICFKNDSQVSKITATKIYDVNPRVEFTLENI